MLDRDSVHDLDGKGADRSPGPAPPIRHGERDASTAVRVALPAARPAARPAATPLVAAIAEVAARHGATSAQVALAWVIRHPNTIAQLEENAAAANLVLADDEVARLSAEAAAFAERVRA